MKVVKYRQYSEVEVFIYWGQVSHWHTDTELYNWCVHIGHYTKHRTHQNMTTSTLSYVTHAGEYLKLLVGVPLSTKLEWLESGSNMLLVTSLYTSPFLRCMYMPVCTQYSTPWQISPIYYGLHIWVEGTNCWKMKSTTTMCHAYAIRSTLLW